MSLTPSTMLSLGTKAPAFSLPDTDGNIVSLDDFKNDPVLLVVFMCNHCPYVKHIREYFVELVKEYQKWYILVGKIWNIFLFHQTNFCKNFLISAGGASLCKCNIFFKSA